MFIAFMTSSGDLHLIEFSTFDASTVGWLLHLKWFSHNGYPVKLF